MPSAATPSSPPLTIVLCCSEGADGPARLADALRSKGHGVSLAMGLNLDVTQLDGAVARHGEDGYYVLCRDENLDDFQVKRIRQRLRAHGISLTRTLSLTAHWDRPQWVADRLATSITGNSPAPPERPRPPAPPGAPASPGPRRPAARPAAPANATMHLWQPAPGAAVEPRSAQVPSPAPSRSATVAMTLPSHTPSSTRGVVADIDVDAITRVGRRVPEELAANVLQTPPAPAPEPVQPLPTAAPSSDLPAAGGGRADGAASPVGKLSTWIRSHRRASKAAAMVGGAVLLGVVAAGALSGSDLLANAPVDAGAVAHAGDGQRSVPPKLAPPQPGPDVQPAPVVMVKPAASEKVVAPAAPVAPAAASETAIEEGDVDDDATAVAKALKTRKIRALDILLVSPRRSKRVNYDGAVSYCSKYQVEGVGNWRMAEIGELVSLHRARMLPRDYYWSGTPADAFGERRLLWVGTRRKISGVSKTWSGARTACVRERGP